MSGIPKPSDEGGEPTACDARPRLMTRVREGAAGAAPGSPQVPAPICADPAPESASGATCHSPVEPCPDEADADTAARVAALEALRRLAERKPGEEN